MEAIQEPKKSNGQADGVSLLREKPSTASKQANGNSKEIDLFHELRKRKIQEAPRSTTIPKEDFSDGESVPKWVRLIIAALIGGAICFLFVSSLGTEAESQQSVSTKKSFPEKRVAAVMESLKAKHGARDWNSAIPESRRNNPFSIEVSDAFLREVSRPVLANGTLLDVAYGNASIEATFELPKTGPGSPDRLILRCRNDQLKLFTGAVRGISEYAVVANCYEAQNTADGCSIIGSLIDAADFSTDKKAESIDQLAAISSSLNP